MANDISGVFITFEGGEGSGKSTQASLLFESLQNLQYPVYLTREPGGTPIGEEIRQLVSNPHFIMTATTEAYLYAASRREHTEQIINPKLANNFIVICDRFIDSSLVYQGIARQLSIDTVLEINKHAFTRWPDITFFVDIDPAIGFLRKEENALSLDRMEQETLEFHKKVREGYSQLACKYDRIEVINGQQPRNIVHDIIYRKTLDYLVTLPTNFKGEIL